jgi:hypothetical protein
MAANFAEDLSGGRRHRAPRAPESTTAPELVSNRDLRGTVSRHPEYRGSELCWRPRVGPADSAPGRKVSGDQHPVDRTTEKRSGPAKHRTPYRDEKLSEIAALFGSVVHGCNVVWENSRNGNLCTLRPGPFVFLGIEGAENVPRRHWLLCPNWLES